MGEVNFTLKDLTLFIYYIVTGLVYLSDIYLAIKLKDLPKKNKKFLLEKLVITLISSFIYLLSGIFYILSFYGKGERDYFRAYGENNYKIFLQITNYNIYILLDGFSLLLKTFTTLLAIKKLTIQKDNKNLILNILTYIQIITPIVLYIIYFITTLLNGKSVVIDTIVFSEKRKILKEKLMIFNNST